MCGVVVWMLPQVLTSRLFKPYNVSFAIAARRDVVITNGLEKLSSRFGKPAPNVSASSVRCRLDAGAR